MYFVWLLGKVEGGVHTVLTSLYRDIQKGKKATITEIMSPVESVDAGEPDDEGDLHLFL